MEKVLTKNIAHLEEDHLNLKGYEKVGGYQGLRKALKTMTPSEVTQLVSDANLRGRGGAGFPTGKKWSFVSLESSHPRYFIANSDEMEPGTFKDRLLLETDPHQLIEGIIIASYAIQADVAYIFLRWAYKTAAHRIRQAIADAYEAGFLGHNILGSGYSLEMHLHLSAGRYMCGEETGLLNALEGKRATPRPKPPFAVTSGLWGQPSVVNNVETLSNVPHIVNNGAQWFNSLSLTPGSGGTKLYGVSGKVQRPGAWELPMGTPIREILYEHAGGMRDGIKFRALLPGGASTDFLYEEHLDLPMDFDAIQKAGSRMGTGTMVILDDKTCPVGMVLNLERFFAQESCGWCTPCRDGLPWTARVLQAIEEGEGQMRDLDRLQKHTRLLGPGHTFCALAPGAMEPLQSALTRFRDDFERHIVDGRCPYH